MKVDIGKLHDELMKVAEDEPGNPRSPYVSIAEVIIAMDKIKE